MSDTQPTQAPGGKMRRVALTSKEEQIIADYRRKTEADRAFNDGLDHALEVLPLAIGDYLTSQKDRDEVNDRLGKWRADIQGARRDV